MNIRKDELISDVVRKAGLIYVSDSEPGISRQRRGKGFCYRWPDGTLVCEDETRKRIKALGVPPAYEDVWICRHANGHIQATGTDARGRKQYRYHSDWQALRDEKKFDELVSFGESLPLIRRRALRDAERLRDPRRMTLGALVLLLDSAYLRIGSKTYRDRNGTYGATTLLKRHIRFENDLELRFASKGGRKIRRRLKAPRLQRVLERIADLPGRELFVWQESDGTLNSVDAGHLNRYLCEIGESAFTAKTFRTWGGTLAAFSTALQSLKQGDPPTIVAMCKAASEELFNTPAVCRRSYVHPSVLALAKDEDLAARLSQQLLEKPYALPRISAAERRLLQYLKAD